MARQSEPDRSGWNKSPDDLAYEELLAQYAAAIDEDDPPAPGAPGAKEGEQKQKGGFALARLLQNFGSSKDGRYAKGRKAPALSSPATGGWALSDGQTPEPSPAKAAAPEPGVEQPVPKKKTAAVAVIDDEPPAPAAVADAPQKPTKKAFSLFREKAPKDAPDVAATVADADLPAALDLSGEVAGAAAPQKKAFSLFGKKAVKSAPAATGTDAAPPEVSAEAAPAPEAAAVTTAAVAVADRPAPDREITGDEPKKAKKAFSLFGKKAPKDMPAAAEVDVPAAQIKKAPKKSPAHLGGKQGPAPSKVAAASIDLVPQGTSGAAALAPASSGLPALSGEFADWALAQLEWVYDETYFLGAQILRSSLSVRRQAQGIFYWLSHNVPAFWMERQRRIVALWDKFCDSTLFPYRDISRKTGQLRRDLRATRRGGAGIPSIPRLLKRYVASLALPLNRIANFLAPIVGCTILAACITYFGSLTYGLSVDYSGHRLGYIADENVFYAAQRSVRERLIDEEYLSPENNPPAFQLTVVRPDALLDQEALASKILEVSNNEVESADGVYVEGVFLGSLRDGREFLVYLDGLLEAYRTGRDYETVQFIKSISVKNGVYPTSSVRTLTEIRDALNSDKPLETVHTVKEGDSLASIAKRYNTSETQILTLNPTLEQRLAAQTTPDDTAETGKTDAAKAQTMATQGGVESAVQAMAAPTVPLIAGEELLIARMDPGLGIQVTWREVYEEDISFGTEYVDNKDRVEGWQQTISAGIPGKQEVTADVTYIDGEKISERRVQVETVKEPVNQRIARGTKPIIMQLTPGVDTSGSFLWPVEGGYVSAGLYSYWGHTGMDIATKTGTPIRASRGGIVTTAVNYAQWPYGKQVVINHGDGYITRYAHMSSVAVTVGQYVQQGQYLGGVGMTGNASGPHCHFEIRYYGQVMNPASYIGNRYTGIWG